MSMLGGPNPYRHEAEADRACGRAFRWREGRLGSGSWPSPPVSGLSVGEAAKQLGIGRTTAYRIMQEPRETPDKGCEQGRLHDVREDVVEIIARVEEKGWTM